MTKQNKFAVGDRVKIYDKHDKFIGKVAYLNIDGTVLVDIDGERSVFHRKQCRLLIWKSHKKITLTRGYYAIVDNNDFKKLNSYIWHVVSSPTNSYAARMKYDNKKQRLVMVKMHREILGLSDPKIFIDHINGNGLDNRRKNLRKTTASGNKMNQRKRTTSSSKYKGVQKCGNKWSTCIQRNYEMFHIGRFDSELGAAKAYDAKARELFGEYACLNFPINNKEAGAIQTKGHEVRKAKK